MKKFSEDEDVHEEKRKRQKTVTGENNEIVVLAAVYKPLISSCDISYLLFLMWYFYILEYYLIIL